MSGATAAHASYNGSGTQGLAVTNKINDTGDIVSVLWNKDKTTKQLLHGSAIIEIPASGDSSRTGSNVIFTLNSDMDCIGDLFLYVKLTQGTTRFTVTKEYGLLNLIERVEFQCGTQIWQTLEFADILALNSTELTEGAYEKFILSTMGMEDTSNNTNKYRSLATTIGTDFGSYVFCVKLPLLTRNVGPILNNFSNISEGGFLTAGAPNQTVKIKIYTNSVANMLGNNMVSGSSPNESIMDLKLYGKHLIMCNEEREQIRNIPGGIAKRVKLTQYKEELANLASSDIHTMEIDCDHFSLFASHLVIQIFDSSSLGNADALTTTQNDSCSLLEADLKLNSTSFCGKLIGGLMTGSLPESLGVYVNGLYTLTDPRVRTFTYVFPLANKAYSGSGVPLNRFDNIRLAVKVHHPATPSTFKKITVTCVGETTAVYANGAASISMY